MDFFDVIDKRVSVRSYQSTPIEREKMEKLIWVIQQAPSAGDLKSWAMIVLEEKDLKDKIMEACFNQEFLGQAPLILIFCADTVTSAKKYGKRGTDLYCIQDATIAAAHTQLAATALGLSTCWVGAFQPEDIVKVLNIPSHLQPVAVMALGYESTKIL